MQFDKITQFITRKSRKIDAASCDILQGSTFSRKRPRYRYIQESGRINTHSIYDTFIRRLSIITGAWFFIQVSVHNLNRVFHVNVRWNKLHSGRATRNNASVPPCRYNAPWRGGKLFIFSRPRSSTIFDVVYDVNKNIILHI